MSVLKLTYVREKYCVCARMYVWLCYILHKNDKICIVLHILSVFTIINLNSKWGIFDDIDDGDDDIFCVFLC